MCGFWRRHFSLKSLRGFHRLRFEEDTRPTLVPLNPLQVQELVYAYNNPSKIDDKGEWIKWVFAQRKADHRHALEIVEGWNAVRIFVIGMSPLIFSTAVGIAYAIKMQDPSTAFTIAGFILTAGALAVALLAIISTIEATRTM